MIFLSFFHFFCYTFVPANLHKRPLKMCRLGRNLHKIRQNLIVKLMEKTIVIHKGQHLADVMDKIPSNVILNKQITGCGATTLEINAARNSIIIEPNVPVIVGKATKHPNVFPVYEKVTFEDVEAYLQKQIDDYRKIVTTPEGYDKKVKPALSKHIKNYKESFFLLFDECEKIIQDVE